MSELDFVRGSEIRIPMIHDYEPTPERMYLEFFRRLFANSKNGFSAYGRKLEPPFEHELVVPGDENKPLVVLQGEIKEIPDAGIFYSSDRFMYSRSDFPESLYSGTHTREDYRLLREPKQTGAFEKVLTITFDHFSDQLRKNYVKIQCMVPDEELVRHKGIFGIDTDIPDVSRRIKRWGLTKKLLEDTIDHYLA